MHNTKLRRLKYRPLLTDTLPYEVPVIFSNDRFYSSLVGEIRSATVKSEFDKLLKTSASATRPYAYSIQKDGVGRTDLGIIHPLTQLRIASFYDQYAQSILECCGRSNFSIRRPARIARTHSLNPLRAQPTHKIGIPHIQPEDGEIDISRIASYFSYSRYNLLFKFYDSQELLRLEKKFSIMRSLDVSKCFFNIYTHSVTWSVKGKPFAKLHRRAYSFESEFDRLMQSCNDSETNGIVVGPETSRIFAEIIFQDIDARVQERLLSDPKAPLVHDRDYAVRRYVDDFLVFASSDGSLDRVSAAIRDELREYKLFVNDRKTSTFSRPFVSQISLARREIARSLQELTPLIEGIRNAGSEQDMSRLAESVSRAIWDTRLVVAKYSVGFYTVSGWLLSRLKSILRQMTLAFNDRMPSGVRYAVFDSILKVVQLVFYVCSLDLRVRTSYSLCQVATVLKKFLQHCSGDEVDQINQVFSGELAQLCSNVAGYGVADKAESIELYNLLICGAFFQGEDVLRQTGAVVALRKIRRGGLRYFSYITCKFCYLKLAKRDVFVRRLNGIVQRELLSDPGRVGRDAEAFLFFCEYLGAPDVKVSDKRKVFKAVVGGAPSNATIDEVSRYVGFADMEGIRIEHMLKRKELRPAYAWS